MNKTTSKPRLAITTIADQPLRGQKSLWPVNVCRGGNAATITTVQKDTLVWIERT